MTIPEQLTAAQTELATANGQIVKLIQDAADAMATVTTVEAAKAKLQGQYDAQASELIAVKASLAKAGTDAVVIADTKHGEIAKLTSEAKTASERATQLVAKCLTPSTHEQGTPQRRQRAATWPG
jgi:predicted HAD superfamily Cof-like phosphohydrolase